MVAFRKCPKLKWGILADAILVSGHHQVLAEDIMRLIFVEVQVRIVDYRPNTGKGHFTEEGTKS